MNPCGTVGEPREIIAVSPVEDRTWDAASCDIWTAGQWIFGAVAACKICMMVNGDSNLTSCVS